MSGSSRRTCSLVISRFFGSFTATPWCPARTAAGPVARVVPQRSIHQSRRTSRGRGGRTTDESACTPGSVHGCLTASRWAVIHLGLPWPAGSSGLPAGSGGQPSNACAGRRRTVVPLDLAPGGVYRATPVTRCAVVSYTAVSPLPVRALSVCSLWHCPAGHPGSLLTTTLPCGARTFLGGGVSPADATGQPTRL